MVSAIIVDDEKHNVTMLQALIKENCPNVNVIDITNNADTAFEKINALKPQLVFLDIKMPNKNGFDLLRMFTEINFEVIFVSAYNEYAITAFEFNALGYILKPIDFVVLQKAVNKAVSVISAKINNVNENISQFVKTLEDKGDKINKITVHHNNEVVFLNVTDFVFIEGKSDFCEIYLKDKTHFVSSKDLKQFDNLLSEIGTFARINRSIILNIDCVNSYTKGEFCEIKVSTGHTFEVSRRKKTEIISLLKSKIIS